MIKQIILDESDIQQAIANAFCVDKKAVTIEAFKDLEGFGQAEHPVTRVKATIEVPMNEQR